MTDLMPPYYSPMGDCEYWLEDSSQTYFTPNYPNFHLSEYGTNQSAKPVYGSWDLSIEPNDLFELLIHRNESSQFPYKKDLITPADFSNLNQRSIFGFPMSSFVTLTLGALFLFLHRELKERIV